MEKALLITPSEADGLLAGRKAGAAAAAAGRRPSGFSALIVGSEFCQNQAPTLSVLKRLAQRFPGVKLGLATSILTDKGLRRWEELFDSLKGKGIVAEVIVNDWGLFPVLERTGPFKISSGRLLTRKLARLLGIPRQRITDYLRGSRAYPDAERTLLLLCWVARRQRGADLAG